MGRWGLAAEDFKITARSQGTACNVVDEIRGAKRCFGMVPGKCREAYDGQTDTQAARGRNGNVRVPAVLQKPKRIH